MCDGFISLVKDENDNCQVEEDLESSKETFSAPENDQDGGSDTELSISVERYQSSEIVKKYRLTGIGAIVAEMRGVKKTVKHERIVLDEKGRVINNRICKAKIGTVSTENESFLDQAFYGGSNYGQPMLLSSEMAPLPTLDVNELRRLVRNKMVRCKICKNRFGEVNIMERHMRDHHPKVYEEYLVEQERLNHEMIERDKERTRIEEILSGGFIPPEGELDAENQDFDIEEIPLPGEDSNGYVPRFNQYGGFEKPSLIVHRRVPFVKKRSPQCPFCDKRFRNEISLKTHIQKKHPTCMEFVQCLECFKCLPSKEYLSDPKAHECEMTYLCLDCKPIRNLCTEDRLWKHKNKFHRGPNSGFRCNECNLKFLTPRKLRKHRKMTHVFSRTFQCHFCEEFFISETALTVHERIHTGILKFRMRGLRPED
ncbi:unnamed protein product [Caenorhabditis auriculariae]|uniref:C2H2-type domain-containing protein n=1 Tax=Caenorhabditis auriculariae TaxID=2777116 RepID=A0A8S1HAI2_9PELO|nr:unnamed protein product [Caenorhabditis auriculariae]